MVDEIPVQKEGCIGWRPRGGEGPLLTGAVHGVREARKEAALLLPVSTLLTFPCAAFSSQGSLRQSSQKPETAAQHKVRAVPAEGVVRLTLHRPEAQKRVTRKCF